MADEKNPIELVAEATALKAQLLNSKAEYEVIAESGLFKNGETYEKGKTITLDKFTGGNYERAKALKFIKDIK